MNKNFLNSKIIEKFLVFAAVVILYISLSIISSKGKIVYYTFQFKNEREKAIDEGLFVSDVEPSGHDSTIDFLNHHGVNFWSSKQLKRKYYGYLFYKKVNSDESRALIIDGQGSSIVFTINKDSSTKYGIPGSVICKKDDTVKLFFYTLNNLKKAIPVDVVVSH